ncbi:hypothetical protein HZA85_02845 [Candidatus Uhrbacteria bacterium]|nr:hypothetical protein [Candidatus Uhrbacteria bacterium]
MTVRIHLIQIMIVLIPIGMFLWLAQIELVPSGVFVVSHGVHDRSPYLDSLSPESRVESPERVNGTWVQSLLDDPVFFFVHPHRHFDTASFEIWFKNEGVPIVEFGGLTQTKPESYDLKPLQNLLIDQLRWDQVKGQGLTLYQKEKIYPSLEAFFANPPSRDRVGVYRADFLVPYRLAGYIASSAEQTIDASLRGTHEMKTYIKNETLDFTFSYMDMNRDEGADPVTITVFNEHGEPVADVRANDDGNMRSDAQSSSLTTLKMNAPGLSEGVYKLVLSASRDIFFRRITTTQQKVVFVRGMYLGDEIGYREPPKSVQIWTASPRLQGQTRHGAGVQNITFGKQVFSLSTPYHLFTFETPGTFSPMTFPKGDVEVFFDGPAAFSASAYFEPDPVAIRSYTQPAKQGIAFILTSYEPPRQQNGWFVQTVDFDTAKLAFNASSWKFAFSLPDIKAFGAKLVVKQINATFTRKPFAWEDLWR